MEPNQQELYEYARKRVKQKKRVYFHFILFFVGSVFLFVVNKRHPRDIAFLPAAALLLLTSSSSSSSLGMMMTQTASIFVLFTLEKGHMMIIANLE